MSHTRIVGQPEANPDSIMDPSSQRRERGLAGERYEERVGLVVEGLRRGSGEFGAKLREGKWFAE